jgi:hypothetical protein
MRGLLTGAALLLVAILPRPALAETDPPTPGNSTNASDLVRMQEQLAAERHAIEQQRQVLDAQEKRLLQLEDALLDKMRAAGMPGAGLTSAEPPGVGLAQSTQPATPPLSASPSVSPVPPSNQPAETVGVKPTERRPVQEVAVLADRGSVLTKAGRVTLEPSVEYTRTDRNRFVFRGIEIPQSVLVGVFDINESRQNILTPAMTARLGLSNRLEIGVKVPWVYRDDGFVLVPLVQNPPQSGAGTIDRSSSGTGIGDVEVTARYLLTDGTKGWPFLIANLQAIAPTGSSPFSLPRDALGNATKSATGFGFWGVSPSITALMATDPATLFGVLGYNFNFGRNVNTRISDVQIDHVRPGSGPNMTVGLGLALNERTSISFAYAHNWVFSTKSRIRPINILNGIPTLGNPVETSTRDLQVGRFLFGISYRVTNRTTINWSVEIGATQDAPDVRTSLRIPITIN